MTSAAVILAGLLYYGAGAYLSADLFADVARKSAAGSWPRWMMVLAVTLWPGVFALLVLGLALGLVLHLVEAVRSLVVRLLR